MAPIPSDVPDTPAVPAHAVLFGTSTASLVILACGFVTGLLAARSLGPDGRGELAVLTVWGATLLYAGTLGLPEAVAYFSAAHPPDRYRIWTTGQAAAIALGVLVTAAGWLIVPLIFSEGREHLAAALRWYLVWFAVPCLGSLCACAWLQGFRELRAFNLSRTSVHVFNAIGVSIVWLTGPHTPWHFAAALLAGNAAGWVFTAAFGPLRQIRAAPPSASLAARMFRYGVRVQVGSWANAASLRLDQLLLSVLAAASALGVYVVAVNYANLVLIIPGAAALAILPEIVHQQRLGATAACLERWYRVLLWVTMAGAVGIALAGVVLVPLLFGEAFAAAVRLLPLLAPATVLLGMNQLLAAAFRGLERPDAGSTAALIGLAVTGGALPVLLPFYGVYGAAAAFLLAAGASHAYLLRQATRVLGLQPRALWRLTRADLVGLRALVRDSLRWRPGGVPHTSAV